MEGADECKCFIAWLFVEFFQSTGEYFEGAVDGVNLFMTGLEFHQIAKDIFVVRVDVEGHFEQGAFSR